MGSSLSTLLFRSSMMLFICLIFSWVDTSLFNGVRFPLAAMPFDRLGTVAGVDISLFYRAIFTIWLILNGYYFLSCINLWELLKIIYFLSFYYWRSRLCNFGRAIILSLYTKFGMLHYLFSSFQSELFTIVSNWSWFIKIDRIAWNFFTYFYWYLIVSKSSYFSSSCSFWTSRSYARFTMYFFFISANLDLISSTSSFKFL